jgi:hypothetical protein
MGFIFMTWTSGNLAKNYSLLLVRITVEFLSSSTTFSSMTPKFIFSSILDLDGELIWGTDLEYFSGGDLGVVCLLCSGVEEGGYFSFLASFS